MSDTIYSKTTRTDFRLFKTTCKYWLKAFGLIGWEIHYEHSKVKEAMGCIYYDTEGRIATIKLSTVFPKDCYTKEQVRQTAFHEVCHLLLARVHIIGNSRFVNSDEMPEALHSIIRVLENVIWEGSDARR